VEITRPLVSPLQLTSNKMENKLVIGRDGTSYAISGSYNITVTGITTFALDDIAYIYNITQDKMYYAPVEGKNTASVSSGIITIDASFDPIVDGDFLHIQMWIDKPGYDRSTDTQKSSVANPEYAHYTDAELLVTASDIVATTTVYKDQGAEIDMRGYETLGIFVKFTVNDSATNTIRALSKHTSAGTEEFVLETAADYIKTLGDANINIYYEFKTNGIPFVQLQSTATTVGATEGVLEIYIIKK